MRILLTNNTLNQRAGSELYLRDVALELMRRGHHPVAYSTNLGPVAAELRAATVPVIQSLDALGEPPDIIHGQHHYETLSAMLRFPDTPAIYYCHGWTPWEETPLRFPRILQYVAVDEVCRERLITEGGIPSDRIELLFNFFDARRFPPRGPLPAQPRFALVFSNTFSEDSDLPVLREACAQCGIELDTTGLKVGRPEPDPGALLQKYDLVFAKARAAIEAMAIGCAVILCNPGRLGSMVTCENFSKLRPLNFGMRTLDRPLSVELLVAEIQRYEPSDATQVTAAVRSQCELQSSIDRLVSLYERVIGEAQRTPVRASADADHAAARYLERHAARFKGIELSDELDRWMKRCLANEAERDRWVERCLANEAELDRWMKRCLANEAERDRWVERCLAAEAERDRLAKYSETMAHIALPASEFSKSRIQEAAEEMMAREGFLGVPVATFEEAGRSQLIELLRHGLRPESKLLDFGCGCLRIAYWLVRFLDPGCYCGIEPARQRVELGLQYLFTPEELDAKRPQFDYNPFFDSSPFNMRFDFFLARSIWTHGSKRQIEATLDSFVRDSNPGATFLTSYLPAQSDEDDYQGDAWVGTSHESDVPGIVRHRLSWIREQCGKRNVAVEEIPGYDCDSQLWLRLTRRSA